MSDERIGIIAGACKPFHRGHDAMFQMALRDNDRVIAFISTTDRSKPGGATVTGDDMARIWSELILPALPSHVEVVFGGEPIGKVYELLSVEDAAGSRGLFTIYGDEKDLSARFRPSSLAKYAPNIYARGQITLQKTERITSATVVRAAIAAGDFDAFEREMPRWMDARRAWAILTHVQSEALLRRFVSALVRTRV